MIMIQSTRCCVAAIVAKRKRQECHLPQQLSSLLTFNYQPLLHHFTSTSKYSSYYSVCTQTNILTTIDILRINTSYNLSNNHPALYFPCNFHGLRKQLSTSTNVESATTSLQNVWINVAKRLLEVPIGSFRSNHWNEAYKCIEQQISICNVISLEVTFRILDRVWKERQVVQNSNNKDSGDKSLKNIRFSIRPELLNIILNCWKNIICIVPEATKNNDIFDSKSFIPETPNALWNIIQKYAIGNIVQCNGITHSAILRSMGYYCTDPVMALDQADILFNQILDCNNQFFSNDDYDKFHPNTATINVMLQLCNKSGHPESYKRAEQFFKLLNNWNRQYKYQRDDMKPTSYTIATIISTWTKAATGSNAQLSGLQPFMAAKRAMELINEYEKPSNGKSFRDDPFLCSTICCALAKAGNIKGAQEYLNTVINLLYDPTSRSDKLAERSEIQAMDENETNESILSYTVATVLDALGKVDQIEKMEALIQQVALIYQQNQKQEDPMARLVHPNIVGLDQVCYRTLIHAYAWRGQAEKAEAAVQHMIEVMNIQPNIATWNAVMHAWSKSGRKKSLQQIQSILKRLRDSNDKNSQPNIDSYNILLSCMATGSDPVSNVQRAEDYLINTMENDRTTVPNAVPKPDIVSYATILRAWCKISRPDLAETLLDQIHRNYQSGRSTISPTAYHYATVMSGWSALLRQQQKKKRNSLFLRHGLEQIEKLLEKMKSQHVDYQYDCKPTTYIYNIILDGLSNSKRPDKANQALILFQSMIQSYEKDRDINLKPDAITLNSVLTVLLRSDDPCIDAIASANEIWNMAKEMDIPTDSVVCTTKMAIFAKYGQVEHVQRTFDEMVTMLESDINNENKRTKPPFHAYVTLLQAKAKAGDLEGTSRVLSDIMSQYENGDHTFKPTTQTFNAVLGACLRSKAINSGEKALQGLRVMNELASQGRFDVKPDLRSYTATLGCYSYSSDPNFAVDRAYSIYEEMMLRNDISPDLRFYTTLISILMKDTDDTRVVTNLTSAINDLSKVSQTIWLDQGYKSGFRIVKMLQQSNITGKEALVDSVVQLGKKYGIPIHRCNNNV